MNKNSPSVSMIDVIQLVTVRGVFGGIYANKNWFTGRRRKTRNIKYVAFK